MDKTNINVEFRVIGESFDPNTLNDSLMIKPTEFWKKGDKFNKKDSVIDRKYSNWAFSTGFTETLSLSEVLERLVLNLESSTSKLIEFREKFDVEYSIDIIVNIENGESPGMYIKQHIIDFAHEIQAELDIDLYLLS